MQSAQRRERGTDACANILCPARAGRTSRWPTHGRFWLVTAALAALLWPAPGRADFDLNGNWVAGAVILGFPISCNIDITQVGTNLSVSGTCDLVGMVNLTGTIDVMAGTFSLSGSAAGICTMADSLTISGTATDNSNFTARVTRVFVWAVLLSTAARARPATRSRVAYPRSNQSATRLPMHQRCSRSERARHPKTHD